MKRSRVKIQATIHVSPSGNDADPGTAHKPFRSPQRAALAVRQMNANMTGDIVVRLAGGRHLLDAPLLLEAQDSGTNGFSIVYEGASGRPAILDGGTRITGWKKAEHARWEAKVDIDAMRHLYVNGRRVPRCTWGLGELECMENGAGYRTKSDAAAQLIGVEGVEFVYKVVWAHTRCRVAEVRPRGSHYEILMKQPEFFLALNKEGVQLNATPIIENAPVDFHGAGQWRFDPKQRTLQYLPWWDQDMERSEFVVPRLTQLLALRGTPEAPVRNIRFRNLGFEHATWLEPNANGFVDIQANFRETPETKLIVRPDYPATGPVNLVPLTHDCVKSPANIVCHAGSHIDFEDCRFARLGGAGLDIERGSSDVRVANCEFTDISGSAIQVADVVKDDHHPDNPAKGVHDVAITDCRIHHVAVEYKGGVGVFVGYAKNVTISHNEIHHLPYSAISVGWGWDEVDAGGGNYPAPSAFHFSEPAHSGGHTVAHNHIHDVIREMDDGGAIYTLGRMPGTCIRANVIHDTCGFPGGIYLDEGSADIRVERNVVYRVARALNLNNFAQDRYLTCPFEKNVCDVLPDDPAFPHAMAAKAGPRRQGMAER